ncbi:UDP-N-acetylmuramoyl-L-alanyl-D-glutamate--2,6-diaminopimelate ligase [Phycicoccus endophyticus]|uniref:UDP-N-acetylmuramoyl-L-alanyl-D-glutamate--2,6-diaminopimelate ligase n=1 Tax=Phycicoccus endophyticus TaxID=1690220 RepID=A0A7G9R550_9MICO|nr:UDP-N-acetylmuramoyl-L-alanyl-D-glutamate--2,6-diaminopimelate ligase [Phycicoccus endophyticus]NHI20914.1 UDP-N-acetylmuramoyl-L-alanyl-D-glutamate--2,6-diaminopimelate ligase [Phycicoccus endophyticus]QNN50725.1 UDP-N-acetylmuramoyl-L-alanyl-D-glutamate--2,6-diaminopimelate ligase [Phycicoccus endophyticus]GGL21989.1 UDP-N-acetylmuramoyl-L-alanyl-D-glutamate--2,6-diaminopimelate ligase [Phycicoccus endophyticus]
MLSPRPTTTRRTPLGEVAALLGVPAPPAAAEVSGVTLDSRAVRPGDLYAALPGARAHGGDYAAQAVAAGAAAVLTDAAGRSRLVAAGVEVPALVVERPRSVLGAVAARVYGTEELPVRLVGITGTNGKTTTAYLVHSALTALGHAVGLIGTVETRIGPQRVGSVRTTPEAPDLHALLAVMAERGLDTCVMEVSSHALAQHRVDGVVYDVALFTNLSQDHLDFHGSMEAYFAAKASLFTPARSRRALVCVDDAWGRELLARATVPVEALATGAEADWSVRRQGPDPAAFRLTGPDGVDLHLRSSLPGDFNVTNTAMAAAALVLLGEPPERAGEAVLADPHVPGRMERVALQGHDGLPRAVVDYAHTPDAIAAALQALRPSTPGTLVCVTGAGGDRDQDKRRAMGAAAAQGADVVVVTDDNPRSEDPAAIRAAVLEGAEAVRRAGRPVQLAEVAGRRPAVHEAVARVAAERGAATVAVLGKGHESGQEVDGVVHPFDDREVLREALRAVAGVEAP